MTWIKHNLIQVSATDTAKYQNQSATYLRQLWEVCSRGEEKRDFNQGMGLLECTKTDLESRTGRIGSTI